jgi:hypothetical protein
VSGAAAASSRSADDNPSETFNANERSSSAFPTLNESMRTLNIGTASASTKDPRSQSLRQVNTRRGLCSAVPDSAVLSPVYRPDEGGSKGQKITVFTNHFRVDIGNAVVNQYDVDIAMIDRNHKMRLACKDDRWEVIQTFVKERKGFPTVW